MEECQVPTVSSNMVSVGEPCKGLDFRLDADGEILVRETQYFQAITGMKKLQKNQ